MAHKSMKANQLANREADLIRNLRGAIYALQELIGLHDHSIAAAGPLAEQAKVLSALKGAAEKRMRYAAREAGWSNLDISSVVEG